MSERRSGGIPDCAHHWQIETPHGAESVGVCEYCGAIDWFPNAFPEHYEYVALPARVYRELAGIEREALKLVFEGHSRPAINGTY